MNIHIKEERIIFLIKKTTSYLLLQFFFIAVWKLTTNFEILFGTKIGHLFIRIRRLNRRRGLTSA